MAKALFTKIFWQLSRARCGAASVCVVDPKKENYENYRLPTLITPNKSEASEASGISIVDEASLLAAGKKLLRKWRAAGACSLPAARRV